MDRLILRVPVMILSLALATSACSGSPSPTPSPTPSARPSSTAVIRIVSPTPGQVVSTKGVIVKISLAGARIVPAGSTTLRPDEGHVHLKVDGRTITLFGGLQVSTGPLTKASHLIQIEFAASDHGPFNPRVIQEVTVTAE